MWSVVYANSVDEYSLIYVDHIYRFKVGDVIGGVLEVGLVTEGFYTVLDKFLLCGLHCDSIGFVVDWHSSIPDFRDDKPMDASFCFRFENQPIT